MPSQELLAKYADVILQMGLAVKPGDRILMDLPLVMPEFGRLLVERAYQLGADNVEALWLDDTIRRARFEHGSDEAAIAIADGTRHRAQSFESGVSYLRILAEDPAALSGLDSAKVKEFTRRNAEVISPAREGQMALRDKWAVAAVPIPAWTTSVFEGDIEEATEKMWEAIFRTCRVYEDDPIAAWDQHGHDLAARRDHLNRGEYVGLRYEGPGTDLTLGLTDDPVWQGGSVSSQSGESFFPNLPTEEVFAVPHRLKGDGVIASSKPLSYFGDLIDNFVFEVSGGEVVKATAERGQETLDRILETDGARRFGEVAMVPVSGAVAREGLVWNNMLFDENDGCHIALGRSYPTGMKGGVEMNPQERIEAGLNDSPIHVDFVIGSPELDVYGVRADGGEEPILLNGEWGFDV